MPSVHTDELRRRRAGVGFTPRPGRGPARFLKHAVDRLVALCGLLVTSPILLVLAVAIRVAGPGPVLRRDRRLREDRRVVTVLSFEIGEELQRRRGWRLLAGSGLAALPQLWNVLRGDLSLVGPRPREVGLEPPPARPGLTGLAQIEQLVRRVTVSEMLELDAEYARTWSLGLDARIVARTMWRTLG